MIRGRIKCYNTLNILFRTHQTLQRQLKNGNIHDNLVQEFMVEKIHGNETTYDTLPDDLTRAKIDGEAHEFY